MKTVGGLTFAQRWKRTVRKWPAAIELAHAAGSTCAGDDDLSAADQTEGGRAAEPLPIKRRLALNPTIIATCSPHSAPGLRQNAVSLDLDVCSIRSISQLIKGGNLRKKNVIFARKKERDGDLDVAWEWKRFLKIRRDKPQVGSQQKWN